jgi:SAM-dependent methyltransferase
MRKLVGPVDEASFDNPEGVLVYPHLDASAYEAVFDFGCGCGRVARQLIQQRPAPKRYVGIDLHPGMIRWCRENLAPRAQGFEFHHHDVANYHFNPSGSKPDVLPFPAEDHGFTLVNAWSVFTHLTQSQTEQYLHECARVLRQDGVLQSTWFFFDKHDFPMLQAHHNALYVSDLDPSAAVLFDREWVRSQAREAGLTIVSVIPPAIRGYQWVVIMAPTAAGLQEAPYPEDTGRVDRVVLPDVPENPSAIGL